MNMFASPKNKRTNNMKTLIKSEKKKKERAGPSLI